MSNGTAFELLLVGLLDGNNAVRQSAEVKFDNLLENDPNSVFAALVETLVSSSNFALRSLSAVLIRRLIARTEGEIFEKLNDETRSFVKSKLLLVLERETNASLRKKICDTVGVIGMFSLPVDDDEENGNGGSSALIEGWPELLPFLFKSVTSPHSSFHAKENALEIFSKVGKYVATRMNHSFPKLAEVFAGCLNQHCPVTTQCASLKAFTWLAEYVQTGSELVVFKPLIPLIQDCLQTLVAAKEWDLLKETLENLVAFAEYHTKFFKSPQFSLFISQLLNLSSSVEVDIGCRHLALEMLVTMSEKAGALMRKLSPPDNAFLIGILPILLRMIINIKSHVNIKAWGNQYPHSENPTDTSSGISEEDVSESDGDGYSDIVMGLEYIDRVAKAIGEKKSVPIMFSYIGELLNVKSENAADWRVRHAGMLVLGQVVEIAPRKEPQLGECVRIACNFALSDAHPRVRYAAITCLARLSYDCSPEVQINHHASIVPCLVKCLDDAIPRVQAHAAVALCNYCDRCFEEEKEFLLPYSTALVEKCLEKLIHGVQCVQEQVLGTIAYVAECDPEGFKPYYEPLVEMLKLAIANIPDHLNQPNGGDDSKAGLKARIVDCISLIGISLGEAYFAKDVVYFAQFMPSLFDVAKGDPLNRDRYQLSWMRFSKIMKNAIAPYLSGKIMPFVFEASNFQEYYEKDEEEEMDEEAKNKLYKARTAAVDDKLLAFSTISCFAENCPEAFTPYLVESLQIFLRDINRNACPHDDVRDAAASGILDVMKAMLVVDGKNASLPDVGLGKMIVNVFEIYTENILMEEENVELQCTFCRSFGSLICDVSESKYSALLQQTPDFFEEACALFVSVLKDSHHRRQISIEETKLEEDVDVEELEETQKRVDAEHDLQYVVSSVIGDIIKSYPNEMFVAARFPRAVYETNQSVDDSIPSSMSEFIYDLARPNRLTHDRKIAIFVLDDIVEFCPLELVSRIMPSIGKALIDAALTSKVPDHANETNWDLSSLQQASFYGLGICANRFGSKSPEFNAIAPLAAQALLFYVQNKEAWLKQKITEEEETYGFGPAFDNAASSLLKITKNCIPNDSEKAYLLLEWLKCLPLTHDETEGKLNSVELLNLAKQSASLGLFLNDMEKSNAVIEKVISVLVSVIGTEYLPEANTDEALDVLLQIQKNHQSVFNKTVKLLSREDIDRLQSLKNNKN